MAFVHKDSAAAMAGLRFGDQVLQINEENVAGWDTEKAMNKLKKCPTDKTTLAVRDRCVEFCLPVATIVTYIYAHVCLPVMCRPFERTVTLQKDSAGTVGFVFKENRITAIIKDTSAARNGVLIDHHLVEVDGQNVVGLKVTVTLHLYFIVSHDFNVFCNRFTKLWTPYYTFCLYDFR